jgi:hypothetical protein
MYNLIILCNSKLLIMNKQIIQKDKRNLANLFNLIDQRTLIISSFGYFIGRQSGRLIIKRDLN